MYLKRLELQGFKSFADKTILEFMPGITTVIGPNGSGKSNISDAIRWVLGEQSMKSLRSSKAEDIIFAGTQNRKSLGFAEASLVFDNKDGKLPIEYLEVTVTRKIYRSGETGYFINKVPCRLKDILELFMDTGIGKDGYSIIGQGKIDEILSNKSEDRRHIFEEAAGIVKYRVRKAESEKKLEQTKLNLLRINDILSEVEGTIEPLKLQSEKAKQFLNLREELKNIEVGLFLSNIDLYKEKLDQVLKDEDIYVSQKEESDKKMDEIRLQKEELQQEVDELIENIEKTQNLGFESEKEKEKLKASINLADERVANNQKNYERYEQEIEQSKVRIKELKEEKEQKIFKQESLNENKKKFEEELLQKQKELDTITEKLSSKEIEIENKKAKINENIDLKYELTSTISSLETNIENIEKQQSNLTNELDQTILELDAKRLEKSEISNQFEQIDKKRNEFVKSLEEIQKKKDESSIKITEYEKQISNIQYEIRMKDSRLKFLQETEKEKEGYAKSVKSLLLAAEKDSNLKNGMEGVLANLISVPQEYEVAIEMALGTSLQNIVTEKEEDAKKFVEYLRKNNLGRASFLPITNIKGKKIEKIISNGLKGIVGIASDLITYNKKYEQIIINLLGRTVIVEDLDTATILARQNNYSFRVITLKGDVINPSGSITGGSVATKTVNILGRGREIASLEKEIKDKKDKEEKIKKEKEEYISGIQDILEESENLEKLLQNSDISYATQKEKLMQIEENVSKLETKHSKLKQNNEKLKEDKETLIKQKLDANLEIEKKTKEIEEWSLEVENYSILNKDSQKRIDDLNLDITNLKISVSSFDESSNSMEEVISRIDKECETHQKILINKEKQMEEIIEDNKNIEQEKINLQNSIIQIEEKTKMTSTEVNSLKEQKVIAGEKLKKIEDTITEQFKIIEDLKEQIVKLDVKKTKIQQDLEQVVNNMWEEYELTPNNAVEYKKPENISVTQKQVNSLRTQIRDLGTINMDSIEEYKRTKERYDFMCEQRLDLEDAVNKLRKIISDMTFTMKQQFKEQFSIINKNFSEVFKELFGGGKAELVLEDEENLLECGINIQVQPPGKKLQNMMLLSGGEKAFTAIAILFAILKINPAPFCVLDEIEAALDDVNVYRFAEYLKKFSKDTQFLVITHRKGTMEAADTVYGITMEENGISKLLSMKMNK